MSVDKNFYLTLMKNLFSDPYELKFWDGEVVNFGEGPPKFRINFNEPLSKSDIIKDPSLAFGEGYMQNKIDIDGSIQEVIESLYNNHESFLRQKNKYFKMAKFISNNLSKSKENAQFHYDIGNDFYSLWLDETIPIHVPILNHRRILLQRHKEIK